MSNGTDEAQNEPDSDWIRLLRPVAVFLVVMVLWGVATFPPWGLVVALLIYAIQTFGGSAILCLIVGIPIALISKRPFRRVMVTVLVVILWWTVLSTAAMIVRVVFDADV